MTGMSQNPGRLPDRIVTASGQTFNPNDQRWQWRGPLHLVNVGFEWMETRAPEITPNIKFLLAWIAEHGADLAVTNNHSRLTHLLKHCAPADERVARISQANILNYRASPAANNGKLAAVAGVLKLWFELEIPGLTPEAYQLLRKLRLAGNVKGEAVRTLDPDDGPLTDLEREAFLSRLGDAYATGGITLEAYALGIVCSSLAPRPIQVAGLKVSDLAFDRTPDGPKNFRLEVPRAKQGMPPRSAFTTRVLTPEIGQILSEQADAVVNRLIAAFESAGDIPLFPKARSVGDEPAGFAYHYTADVLGDKISRLLTRLGANSERTGGTLKINATRFRRTLGTNAAKEGHGPLIIAALLDHTDTQNVDCYTEAGEGFIEHLDRTMAFQLGKLAQAFSGLLIPDEGSALRAGDKDSRILGPEQTGDFDPLGNCGSFSFCALNAPLACYTCRNFQPWLEAPHEAVLEWLLNERRRLVAVGDLRIASVRDRTLLAVAAVVLACLEYGSGDSVE